MLTQEYLKSVLKYNSDTGIFTWLKSVSNNVKVGSTAGYPITSSDGKRYHRISVQGRKYQAHRLVWLYVYGEWPKYQIDHIDGDGLNNSIDNLRDVTPSENNKNMRRRCDNKSGINGVTWDKARQKWFVQISTKNKTFTLGRFNSKFDASCARKSAELRLNFHEQHGSNRPL